MKRYLLFVLFAFMLMVAKSQKPLVYSEYAQYWQPRVTDIHFADIKKLKDELVKNKIADNFFENYEEELDGKYYTYASWKSNEEGYYYENYPKTNHVGVLISQKLTYPIDYINGSWLTCCYDRGFKHAMNLSVRALNCDDEHYKKFTAKIDGINKLLNISLLPMEKDKIAGKKPFINKSNGYNYIFDKGIAFGYHDTSFTYLVIPQITHVIENKVLIREALRPTDIIKKDTLSLIAYAMAKPFNNYDSLKNIFLSNGVIPQNYAEVYPYFFFLLMQMIHCFLIVNGSKNGEG